MARRVALNDSFQRPRPAAGQSVPPRLNRWRRWRRRGEPTRCVQMLHVSLCRRNTRHGGKGGGRVSGQRSRSRLAKREYVFVASEEVIHDGSGTHRAQRTPCTPCAIPGVDARRAPPTRVPVHVHTLQHHRRIVAPELAKSESPSRELVVDVRDGSSTTGAHTSPSTEDPSRSPCPSPPRDAPLARSKPAPTGRAAWSRPRPARTWRERRGTCSLLRASTHGPPRGPSPK